MIKVMKGYNIDFLKTKSKYQKKLKKFRNKLKKKHFLLNILNIKKKKKRRTLKYRYINPLRYRRYRYIKKFSKWQLLSNYIRKKKNRLFNVKKSSLFLYKRFYRKPIMLKNRKNKRKKLFKYIKRKKKNKLFKHIKRKKKNKLSKQKKKQNKLFKRLKRKNKLSKRLKRKNKLSKHKKNKLLKRNKILLYFEKRKKIRIRKHLRRLKGFRLKVWISRLGFKSFKKRRYCYKKYNQIRCKNKRKIPGHYYIHLKIRKQKFIPIISCINFLKNPYLVKFIELFLRRPQNSLKKVLQKKIISNSSIIKKKSKS